MSCSVYEEEGKRLVVLIFKRSQLLYDIENNAYIEGSVMPKDTEAHNRHMVQDVGQEGNVDTVSRTLDLCHAQAKEMLYPYTKCEIRRADINNKLREPKVYGIVMCLPDYFSHTTLLLIEKLIHKYMVCKALEEWLSITHPQRSQIWREKAEETEKEIRSTMNHRRSKVRRKLHPFG